ncbi:TetR family transcriptional regulator [Dactylosporangium matsuzakiense]|uniref:TetR family transcriptional regulator n=1 Tax=Dactylosporangium matsuzakiense TaxID=53360 RepID=A0A9W6NTE8_9ACTN|nr:TetR family transcriptional regulator [Dactylosporangium matsuzakiense]GLL08336.1 TetR family transcriptional regulator [Dactylosporangium matsuzakiense]
MEDNSTPPLRERKHHRTRATIIEAAMTLFAEHGFDNVTVSGIAARAEVGRSTFFRYFVDKQEVMFADDAELKRVLVTVAQERAAALTPIGDSLAAALDVATCGVLAVSERIAEHSAWLAVRQRLIEEHPDLQARNLVKQYGYVEAGVEVLLRHGATLEIAVLASNLAAACFAAGHARALAEGIDLPAAVSDAFARFSDIAGPSPR